MTCDGACMDTTEQSGNLVVCDAGPLIHLDEVGCLDLLSSFSRILVPDAVWHEVQRHRPSALKNQQVSLLRAVALEAEPAELEALGKVLSLHPGEREAICVALEHGRALLLTDDAAARLAAGSLGLVAHGTIGVLVRAIRKKQRTREQVVDILKGLPTKSTLHLKRSLLESVIAEILGS
jgi:predicted nucleic acid-binding protein